MRAGVIDVVGVLGGVPYAGGAAALARADVVVGSARQLAEAVAESGAGLPAGAERVELAGPLDAVLAIADERAAGGARVCVLASGDPGFFGIVRALGARVGPDRLAVHPAPSSVALAFARIGLTWDDAVVASAHGRPLAAAVAAAAGAPKLAVLTAPDTPPQAVGRELLDAGRPPTDPVAVAAHLGGAREEVTRTDLAGLAAGTFDPMSVVVVLSAPAGGAAGVAERAGVAWGGPSGRVRFGLDVDAYEHRDGMITKPEVRAVVLARLALPDTGTLWDLGAGSGSVAVECARLAPGLDVVAVDRDPDQVARIRANADAHGVRVTAVAGSAPAVLDQLPDPDRVFVGGGGLDVLDAARARVRPGGVVVATYAVLERAIAAHGRLGAMAQVAVSRAVPIGSVGTRLAPDNPVFVCWGGG